MIDVDKLASAYSLSVHYMRLRLDHNGHPKELIELGRCAYECLMRECLYMHGYVGPITTHSLVWMRNQCKKLHLNCYSKFKLYRRLDKAYYYYRMGLDNKKRNLLLEDLDAAIQQCFLTAIQPFMSEEDVRRLYTKCKIFPKSVGCDMRQYLSYAITTGKTSMDEEAGYEV